MGTCCKTRKSMSKVGLSSNSTNHKRATVLEDRHPASPECKQIKIKSDPVLSAVSVEVLMD